MQLLFNEILEKKKKKIVVACKEIKIPEKILDPCNPKEHDQWFI